MIPAPHLGLQGYSPASGNWEELPTPVTKRYEFGSFVINRTLYIVGGHRYVEEDEYSTQYIQACEYLDLDNLEKGWQMTWGEGQEHLPTLLWSTNTTLGPTFATKISDHAAVFGGLNTRKLFMFCDNKFSLIKGDDLRYDAFNTRHHKLVRWPYGI